MFIVLIFFIVISSITMRDIYIPEDLALKVFGKQSNYVDSENGQKYF